MGSLTDYVDENARKIEVTPFALPGETVIWNGHSARSLRDALAREQRNLGLGFFKAQVMPMLIEGGFYEAAAVLRDFTEECEND